MEQESERMRCAYCGQPCKVDAYGSDYEEYDVEMINGMEITIHVHNKCLPKILGEWTMNRVHSPQYGPQYGLQGIQYGYVSGVTRGTDYETAKITKGEE